MGVDELQSRVVFGWRVTGEQRQAVAVGVKRRGSRSDSARAAARRERCVHDDDRWSGFGKKSSWIDLVARQQPAERWA